MEGMSAVNALDSIARTISRSSLGRSRESRSAAEAGKDNVDDTIVLLKESLAFRKHDNDLRQSVSSFKRCLAITMRCISDVPSPISQILASRIIRSTG